MAAIIQISKLVKNYSQGPETIEVLKELSLEIESGETVAILGPSGSGKSTLLSLLGGLDSCDSGSLVLDGLDLTQIDEEKRTLLRSTKIGIVYQQFHLLKHLNAWENVALPLEILAHQEKNFAPNPSAEQQAKEILTAVQLGHRLTHFPHQLSGGECQRVALARALVPAPPILLADEPTGNLDQKTGELVMDLLFSLIAEKKMTLILVTHNRELARRCQKTYLLHQGQLHRQ